MNKLLMGSFIAIGISLSAGSVSALQPGQSEPKRLYSIGDSTTTALNAYLPFDNKNLSWSNGHYGFWQQLLGLPNVNSHYQRIQSAFGTTGTENMLAAQNGAKMQAFSTMASGIAGRNVTYTTVLLGSNDVCASSPAALPTDAQFEQNMRAGMDQLMNNLPNGATVLVAGIPDIEGIYQIGLNKNILGIVNCSAVWSIATICQSMLASENTDADRQYVKSRNLGYNTILQSVTADYQAQSTSLGKNLFFQYNDGTTAGFTNTEISDIDCFHPSELGQESIARETWQKGPFSTY